MRNKYRVGILTWYNHGNYGSALQAYALQRALLQMGYNVEVIAYRMRWTRARIKPIKSFIIKILCVLFEHISSNNKYTNHFRYFYLRYIDFSATCEENNIAKITNGYDAIIAGSDQIWSPAFLDTTYLLNFCKSENVRKIAYAPSFGLDKIPNNLQNTYKESLSDFYAISVREQVGSDLLKQLGFDSEVVVDPTLLLSKNDYEKIENKMPEVTGQYIFCYFLRSDVPYQETVKNYSIQKQIPIYGISANSEDYSWMKNVGKAGPREFLWLVHHASIVLTNSYHCTLFSLIFEKQFYLFERFYSEDPICQNSRIHQLERSYNISNRIIRTSNLCISDTGPYDYNDFLERLLTLKEKSLEYLSESLTRQSD